MKAHKLFFSLIFIIAGSCLFAQKADKAETQILITHSLSSEIEESTSVSCNQNGVHYENSYYRNFDLYNDFYINGEWIVENVEIGAALAQGTDGTQIIKLKFYTMPEGSPLVPDSMTLLYEQEAVYYDTDTDSLVNYPILELLSIPARQNLVVEVFTPDGQEENNYFFIAANSQGETAPSYIRAPACNQENPVALSQIGYPDMHIIMNIYGRYASPFPELLSFEVPGQITGTQITDEPAYTATLTMPYDSSLSALVPTVRVPAGFISQPANGDTVDFSQGPVQYTVTNEAAKIEQSWMVYVDNSSADILDFYIQGQIGETEISGAPEYEIRFFMPGDTSLTNLTPEVQVYSDFVVSPPSGSEQDFSRDSVIYTVKHSGSDYSQDWTVYADQPVSSAYINDKSVFRLYPNPAKHELRIENSEHKSVNEIRIYNLSGKLVLSEKVFPHTFSYSYKLQLPSISRGLYLLRIIGDDAVYTEKLFIAH
jgi:hypothetical protein